MVQSHRISSLSGKRWSPSPALAEALEGRQLLSANTSDISAPANWHWYQGVTASFLANATATQGSRIVDLQVQTASPLTFNAALVRNAGSYSSAWYWYSRSTPTYPGQGDVSAVNGRIVSLDPYVINGNVFYATLLVPNTRSRQNPGGTISAKPPRRLPPISRPTMAGWLTWSPTRSAAPTDYTDVMISNTGADAKNWHWYYGVTPNDFFPAHEQKLSAGEPELRRQWPL